MNFIASRLYILSSSKYALVVVNNNSWIDQRTRTPVFNDKWAQCPSFNKY